MQQFLNEKTLIMKVEKTNRILFWLNLLLLIIICSAITTFVVMTSTNKSTANNSGVINSMSRLKEELALTDEQYEKVNLLNDKTIRLYNIVMDMMCQANLEMLEELSRNDFNSSKLDSLAKNYGVLNTSLRRHTIEYFKNVKSICNEDQKKRLTLIFKQIMELEEQCVICNKKDCPRKDRIKNLGNY
jgi:hypothetical protein